MVKNQKVPLTKYSRRTFMKKLISFTLLLTLMGCSGSNSIQSLDYTPSISHDYSDMIDRFICWDDIFLLNKEHYFVYIFSYTCRHCNSIKNTVLEYAMNNDNFYFIEYSKVIPIVSDIESTINQTELQYIGILGTPTLLEIYDNVLIMNAAGENEISNFLANPQ